MHFLLLLAAISVFFPVVHATLSQDLSIYLAAHPELKGIKSTDQGFLDWQSKVLPDNFTKTALPVLSKAYIVQLRPGSGLTKRGESAHSQFHKRASDAIDYDTRYEFKDSSVFFGLSIQVKDDANETTLQQIPNVIAVWPVTIFPRPTAVEQNGDGTGVYNDGTTTYNVSATAAIGYNANSVHAMTDVDRLHEAGIKGKGVKIAIMDTGVDYLHPALGGCFGPGCTVSFGKSFVDDDGTYIDNDDPLTTCIAGGHGTHVTGIVGMQDPVNSTFGLVGVAPEAEIGMYRVFSCSGGAASDVLLLAFNQAYVDKVDILSMSLGSLSQWETDDYFASVVAALEENGIAVIIANGNNGGIAGSTSSPAIDKKAIAVGSVQNSHFPTVYIGKDSRGRSFKYSGNPWPVQAPAAGLKVYQMLKIAASAYSPSGCSADAWQIASNNITDKDNAILVMPKGGGCSASTKLNAGSGYGFKYVLVYSLEDGDIYDLDYNALQPNPPYYSVSLNVVDGQTLVGGLELSDDYRLFFPNQVFESHTQKTGGATSSFTSMGPASDTLSLKPQLSAPGEAILSTWPLLGTGYTILSGTSMATPYMAGAFALLKSQFPTWTVQQLRERMQSTAKSTPYVYDGTIQASAAGQGSGLINVYDAIHYESSVSPSELNLGDLDALKPQTITIENKSSRTKTYVISHAPAGVANILPNQYSFAGNGTVWPSLAGQYSSYATVSFSETSITLKAGESANFTATFSPPTDIADRYLPVYSGMLTVKNNYEVYTITYIGQPYSRYNATYIDATTDTGVLLPLLLPAGNFDTTTAIRTLAVFDYSWAGFPYIEWLTMQSIQYFRCDAVPYNTSFVPDFYGFTATPSNTSNPYNIPDAYLPLQYPNATALPLRTSFADAGLKETYGIWDDWDSLSHPSAYLWGFGPSVEGKAMPNGDYRVLLRVLRWDGDWLKEEDYQSWLSPILRIAQ